MAAAAVTCAAAGGVGVAGGVVSAWMLGRTLPLMRRYDLRSRVIHAEATVVRPIPVTPASAQ